MIDKQYQRCQPGSAGTWAGVRKGTRADRGKRGRQAGCRRWSARDAGVSPGCRCQPGMPEVVSLGCECQPGMPAPAWEAGDRQWGIPEIRSPRPGEQGRARRPPGALQPVRRAVQGVQPVDPGPAQRLGLPAGGPVPHPGQGGERAGHAAHQVGQRTPGQVGGGHPVPGAGRWRRWRRTRPGMRSATRPIRPWCRRRIASPRGRAAAPPHSLMRKNAGIRLSSQKRNQ